MMYGISSYSLADTFKITPDEAEQLYTDFYSSYPVVTKWFKEINEQANSQGFVTTAWGRKRRFLGHKETAIRYKALMKQVTGFLKKPAEEITRQDIYKLPYRLKSSYFSINKEYGRVMRQSINAVIQGSSADIMKLAMIDLNNHLKTKGESWKMIGTIHDEVLIELPATATIEEIEELATIQKQAVTLTVPMKVDVEISERWGAGISLEEYKEARALGLSVTEYNNYKKSKK